MGIYFKNSADLISFLKYLIVGSIATGTDFLLLYFFVDFFHIYYILAAAISFITAVIISYFLNKNWTFRDKEKRLLPQLMKYIGINLVSLALSLIILYLLVEFLFVWYILAKAAATVVAVIWNFFAMRTWVFQKEKAENLL
jgi:putative flippase GtrA